MREIKFRAWDSLWSRQTDSEHNFMYSDAFDHPDYAFEDMVNMPERFHLMQFIGLQDPKRNNADVYVGDIYNWLGIIRAITVDDTNGYRFMFGKDQLCRSHIEGEYLGNIHENPELVPSVPTT